MDSGLLAIIEEPGQIDKLISLARTKQRGDVKPRVIALHKDVCQELARRGLEFKALEDYGLSDGDIEDEGLKWLRSFPDIKTKDNKNIKELITYKDISVWWLVDELFYLSPYVFSQVKELVKQVIILDHITKAENSSTVYYVRNDTPVSRAIEFICKSKNIATVKIPHSSNIKRLLSQGLRAIVYKYGPWLQLLVRKACWVVLGQSSRPRMILGKGKRLLTFSGDNWVDVYDLITGQIRKGDPYYDSLVDLLGGDYDVVTVVTPTGDWGIRGMKEKAQQQRVIYRPFEHYLNRKVVLTALKASKELHRNYQSLAECEGFRQSLNLHNMPLYDLVEEKLSLFFSRGYLTKVVTIVEMAKCMIEAENPDVILMGDSPIPQRAIIAAAKSKGIPTIAAMHGANMIPYNPCFNHTPEDIGPNGEATAPYCPTTDKFVVNGEQDKDIIVKRARFPEEDVVIGEPRYDVLAKADKLLNREKIFYRLNLNPAKKLVTWMTISHNYTPQENKKNVIAVYNAIKSFKDIQLVIKLHPSENRKAALYREDRTLKPTIIGGFGTITFELLYISDIVITHYCTTAIEALMLNKPVIVIDFSGTPISVPYVESGAAVGIFEEDALVSAIGDILHNEEACQRLAKAREKFISDGNLKPDGQASQRVTDLIRQISRE